jgi:hypothetical protein
MTAIPYAALPKALDVLARGLEGEAPLPKVVLEQRLLRVRALLPVASLRVWRCRVCSIPARQCRRAIKNRPLMRHQPWCPQTPC